MPRETAIAWTKWDKSLLFTRPFQVHTTRLSCENDLKRQKSEVVAIGETHLKCQKLETVAIGEADLEEIVEIHDLSMQLDALSKKIDALRVQR